jgi:hypothetical protein
LPPVRRPSAVTKSIFKATFDFNPTAQTLTIYLLNLESDPTDISQTLGSLRFDITNAGNAPTLVYQSSSIGNFDLDKHGRPTSDTLQSNTWSANSIGGNTIGFCAVCATGGTGIGELLIGGPNAKGDYANANTSLTGRTSSAPFTIAGGGTNTNGVLKSLDSSPSWVYLFPDMTPQVMVSNVIFGFGEGTAYGSSSYEMASYTEYDTPELESNVLVATGLGLVLIAAASKRYLRSRQ